MATAPQWALDLLRPGADVLPEFPPRDMPNAQIARILAFRNPAD